MQQHQIEADYGKTNSFHLQFFGKGGLSIAATAAAGLPAVGAGGAFPVRLRIEFGLFHF
jgi:hypothetical protein